MKKKRLTPIARTLRKRATPMERLLWRHLRDRQLGGHKFRRQHPVGGFVVDFLCLEARVIVEVDGGGHATDEGRAADAERDRILSAEGYQVLRFWNSQVQQRLPDVLAAIYAACEQGTPPTTDHRARAADN